MPGQSTHLTVVAPISAGSRRSGRTFVAQLQAGDVRAHSLLFRRYYERVWAVLQRMLGYDAKLCAAADEVFLRAYDEAALLKGDMRLGAWLLRIAVRVAAQRLHSQQRAENLGGPGSAMENPPFGAPEADALKRTYAILDCLPAEERLALALRDLEGMRLEHVADACGVSMITAQRRLSSGRSRFERFAEGDRVLCGWLEASS